MRQRNSFLTPLGRDQEPASVDAPPGSERAATWMRSFGDALSVGFRRLLRADRLPIVPSGAQARRRFIVFATGRQPLQITSGERWESRRMRAGHVLALRPDEQCDGRAGLIGPGSYWWIALGDDPSLALPGMSVDNGRRLRTMLNRLERRTFPCSPQLQELLGEWSDTASLSGDLGELAYDSAIQAILVQLLRDGHAPPPAPLALDASRALRRAITLINSNLAEPLPWERLARETGCGPTRLWQLFKQEIGQSPTEYLNSRRVNRAMRLLRSGRQTNTEVAHELGFSTSQYFSVVFRRLTGMTPTDFSNRFQRPK